MKQLFLRHWAKLFLSLLLAAVVAQVLVKPRVDQQHGSNVVQSMEPLLRAMEGEIARG